jgi:hypothetical protein
MGTKRVYVQLIVVILCALRRRLPLSAGLMAEVEATNRVVQGQGKAWSHPGKVCPANRYNLMTSNVDSGECRVCPVNRCEQNLRYALR